MWSCYRYPHMCLITVVIVILHKTTLHIIPTLYCNTFLPCNPTINSLPIPLWTCNMYCLLSACLQMQMNVRFLARRYVKEASVWIPWAAMSVTARPDRTTILPSWSAEVRVIHSQKIHSQKKVFVCLSLHGVWKCVCDTEKSWV